MESDSRDSSFNVFWMIFNNYVRVLYRGKLKDLHIKKVKESEMKG